MVAPDGARRTRADHPAAISVACPLAYFVWWTGLTVADANVALEGARSELSSEEDNKTTWWVEAGRPGARFECILSSPAAYRNIYRHRTLSTATM